jgi:hypothetical protein
MASARSTFQRNGAERNGTFHGLVERPVPSNSERLRILAAAVERLGTSGRTDPETTVLAKLSVAAELRRLAAEMDR